MIKHIFGWDNVIVINGDDSYSANGATAFKNAAGGKDLNVLQSLEVAEKPTCECGLARHWVRPRHGGGRGLLLT